jgi:phage gpG-like protein
MNFSGLGGLPPGEYVVRLKAKHRPTQADNLALAEFGKTKILKLTEQGLDFAGNSFAPYSTKGPIYVYPNSAGSRKATASQRHGSSTRFAKAIGRSDTKNKSRIGLKFASYADYKASLGGGGKVNLSGPNNHMLRQLQTKSTAQNFTIGIYDEATAVIATAHNNGAQTGRGHKVRLPQRRFLDFSRQTLAELQAWLGNLLEKRIKES